MKKNIHHAYSHTVIVTCSCGNSFTTGSIKGKINVEVCAKCHPFYTGEQKFLDVKGRVDTFNKKMQAAQAYQTQNPKKNKKSGKDQKQTKSLRELLGEA